MTNKKLRILFVAPSLRITGGQAVQAARLIQELQAFPQLQVDFQAVNPILPGPLQFLQRIKFVRTLVTESVYILALLSRLWRYDVIHLFSAGYWSFLLAPAPAILLSKLFGKKTVLNYRDGQAEDHLNRWPIAVRIISLVDRIVPPSGFLVGVFAKFGLPATYIHNIVDTTSFQFRARPNPGPKFFHNRGMEPLYNIPCTLKAFAIVQQKYAQASLTLAHDGPLRPQLESMVKDLNLSNVQFLGFVDQTRMRQLYREAEIYLMSPNIDNMPGSILECYACGLPFVSTAAGGVPFIVENERTGLLVPINDHQAMANAAIRLMEEPGLAQALTTQGFRDCDRYKGPQVAQQWFQLYKELVSTAK
jgi:L-malate glycosyltransferase